MYDSLIGVICMILLVSGYSLGVTYLIYYSWEGTSQTVRECRASVRGERFFGRSSLYIWVLFILQQAGKLALILGWPVTGLALYAMYKIDQIVHSDQAVT